MMFISHIFVDANKNQYRFLFVFLKLIFRFGTVLMSSLDVQKWISLLFFRNHSESKWKCFVKKWFLIYCLLFESTGRNRNVGNLSRNSINNRIVSLHTFHQKTNVLLWTPHRHMNSFLKVFALFMSPSLAFSKSCWMFVCADARVRRTFTFFPFFGLRFKEISVDIFRFTSYTCFVAFAV